MQSEEKRQYTLRVAPATFAKVEKISELEHRSVAMQLEFIIEKFIAQYEKENGEVEVSE